MGGKTIKHPDAAAMARVLEQEKGTVSEVILRLAWQAGLSRDEIRQLKWSQVSLAERVLRLEERTVPMEEEVAACLEQRAALYRHTDYVVTGNRGAGQLEPQSISRLARLALDREDALRGIALKDLRHGFIVEQLGEHPWPYVARISGVASTTMYTMFPDYMRDEPAGEAPRPSGPVAPDEFFAWKLVQAEGPTPVGLALWMAWRHCMDGGEIIALTWADVDLDAGVLRLPDREVELDTLLKKWLLQVQQGRGPQDDPHVLLTPRSRRPYEASRLSKATRTVFIRHGAEDLTFQDFLYAARRNAVDSRLLKALSEKGVLTRGDVVELLGITPSAAYSQLRRLADAGVILRVGGKYYLPGRVVPPEQQYEAVRQYLENLGVAYLQALADLLKIERRACARILRGFIQEGRLARRGQMYVLPASGSREEQV